MSKLSSFKRHLNPQKVWLANQVAEEKIKIARQVVLDRAKKDAEFAADVLKAVGENLPKEIKEACEESVKNHEPIVGGDVTDKLVPIELDGGGTALVSETELPDYPRDGDEPPLDITEKLVQEEGPKAEKA